MAGRVTLPDWSKALKYCKFDLFTDECIGLSGIEDVATSQSLIAADQDEDYLTDHDVMRNTKKLCRNDLLETYRRIVADYTKTECSTHNYKY